MPEATKTVTKPMLPRQGDYAGTWHRFTSISMKEAKTKCQEVISDVYNIRFRYDYRRTAPCPKCWVGEGKAAVEAELEERPEFGATDHVVSKRPVTTPVADVPKDSDGGDAESSPEEGSGVRKEDRHVGKLPRVGKAGSSNVEGSTDSDSGQDEPGGESGSGSGE